MTGREGVRKGETEGREWDGRGVATGVVRSCIVLVFSVSLDIPSTKQQSPR